MSAQERPVLPLGPAVAVAAVAGLAFDAAFPALGWWPLTFPAVALALVTLRGRRFWDAVLVGGAYGIAFYLPHVSWAGQFLGDHPLAWLPWVALAVAEALLMALLAPLIAFAYRWLPQWRDTAAVRLVLLPAVVAGAWTTRELVMSHWPYGGFPWGRVAMSQAGSPIAPVASWVGVTGLGFLIVALCASVVETVRLVRTRRESARPPAAAGSGARRPHLARAALVVPVALLAGPLFLLPAFPTQSAGTLRVGAVQGDGPAAYVDQSRPLAVLDSQLAASQPLRGEQVDVVLWPEGAVDSDPMVDADVRRTLDAAARRYGAPILMNAASASGGAVYNTSFLWTETGPRATHAKRHPVPFGEYVPDRWFYEAIAPDLVNLLEREYAPGTDPPVLELDDTPVGLAICFDVAFDDVVLEAIENEAQVFMFQTNNADFRGTDENLQQLDFARMRGIESGRSVINLSTTGTSQAFAPDGTVLDALPAGEPGLMVTEVERRQGRTMGVVLSPWLHWLVPIGTLTAIGALAVGSRLRRARR